MISEALNQNEPQYFFKYYMLMLKPAIRRTTKLAYDF
nr:MAG TPA: hypothetical protein [Caudoviricetes sp.]